MSRPKKGKPEKFTVRFAEEKDTEAILAMVRELAAYEKLLDKVEANDTILRDSLFKRRVAEAVIAEQQGKPVGYAVFFSNFSTFKGKAGLFVEDIYVKPELRRNGLGRQLLAFIARIAVERGCERLEWTCLDWNKPSISFYNSVGAKPLEKWIMFRLADADLRNLAIGSLGSLK
jgi:GNAT superfamily N-acetyltransferase